MEALRARVRPITASLLAGSLLVSACSGNHHSVSKKSRTTPSSTPTITPKTTQIQQNCHIQEHQIIPNKIYNIIPTKGSRRDVAYQLSLMPNSRTVQIIQQQFINGRTEAILGGSTMDAYNTNVDIPEKFGNAIFMLLNPNDQTPDVRVTICDT